MSKYLQDASKLAKAAAVLTDTQKKAIETLEKQADEMKRQLEIALELIEQDEKDGKLTHSQAKVQRSIAEAETEEAISEIHTKIREINPSFVSNAREMVEDTAQRFAYNAVEFSGKAAGMLGQVLRPFVQAAREGYAEGRATAAKPYTKPESKKSRIEQLRDVCK